MVVKEGAQSGSGVNVNVKLARGVDREQAGRILERAPGVRSVTQLFPEERDDEMLGMYMLEVDSKSVDAAVRRLSGSPGVESAHETSPRRLIF